MAVQSVVSLRVPTTVLAIMASARCGVSLVVQLVFTFFYVGSSAQEDFVCPLPNGLFPDPNPDACVRFYQCDNDIPFLKFCPSGSLFDTYKQLCVDRHLKVFCGPQPSTEAPVVVEDPHKTGECDVSKCDLPYCFCSPDSTAIPGNLTRDQVPQIMLITFDAGVNQLNYKTYNSIFLDNRTNSNGCPIRGTFFVSHEYTDYSLVQDYYSKGHEMAVGSVTRRAGLESASFDDWVGEMVSMREILKHWAGVDPNEVIGMRAPHLKPGKNTQYEVLLDYGFVWDSSLTAPPGPVPVWPYTLDYAVNHECKAGTCPTHSFPGVWELPMNSHYGESVDGGFCPYLDQCVLLYLSEDGVVEWLKKDFHRHYDNNRAPYQLTLTANWFATKELHRALLRFIDYTLSVPDVHYTTMTEALQWISAPVPLSQMQNYEPWDCNLRQLPQAPCSSPRSCPLSLDSVVSEPYGIAGGTRYMVTCSQCPRKYPWIFDAAGTGLGNDQYEKTPF